MTALSRGIMERNKDIADPDGNKIRGGPGNGGIPASPNVNLIPSKYGSRVLHKTV